MSSSDVSAAAERMAEPFEGFRAQPYQDVVGVWTIGFGSTHDTAGRAVSCWTAPVTLDEARAMAVRDMRAAFQCVEHDVHVPMSDAQAVALTDFVFNLGAGSLADSTLLRKLNAGDYTGAAAEFDKWDHAGARVLAGLLRRREAEREEFTTVVESH